jgi:multidrug resistance protein
MSNNEDIIIDSRETTISNTQFDSKEADKPNREERGNGSLIDVDYSQYTLKRRPWRLNRMDFSGIVSHDYRGSGTEDDPFVVTWLDQDAENPMAYTELMRWGFTLLISSMTLGMALASSTYSGAVEDIIEDFDCSEEVVVLGLSLTVLGYAVGPLAWGPLSEIYGRRDVFIIAFVFYTMWTSVTCAAQNIQTLLVFRFFSGVFGASALVIPGGQIADVFPTKSRGLGIAAFCAAPFLGPALGPAIGGFLGDAGGWRWVMGFLAIYSAALTALGFLFIPETYPPVLLRRRARLLSEVTGFRYVSVIDVQRPLVLEELVKKALIRPWVLLFREPIVLILTVSQILSSFNDLRCADFLRKIYMSCVYATLYLCFAAFPIIFQQERGWSPGVGGLAFMGVFVGLIIGILIVVFDNQRFVRLMREMNGHPPPETRLPPAIFGGGALVVGLAWFAATDAPGVHWASPICAGIPFGMGFVLVFVCLGNYL